MQCIIMTFYNTCYDSCGCILCMQKINNVHVCTCVCVQVCVCVCIHNVHVCTCVCALLSVCVCVCACLFCTHQLHSFLILVAKLTCLQTCSGFLFVNKHNNNNCVFNLLINKCLQGCRPGSQRFWSSALCA